MAYAFSLFLSFFQYWSRIVSMSVSPTYSFALMSCVNTYTSSASIFSYNLLRICSSIWKHHILSFFVWIITYHLLVYESSSESDDEMKIDHRDIQEKKIINKIYNFSFIFSFLRWITRSYPTAFVHKFWLLLICEHK
jgi:hypothetical protein